MEGGGIVIKYMFLIMSYHVLKALIGVLGKHVVEAPGQLECVRKEEEEDI